MKENLLAYRQRAGYSIERVAFEMKVEEKTVQLWESGKAEPTPDQALALAGLYRCRLADLVEEKKTKVKAKKAGKAKGVGQYSLLVTIAYLILGTICDLWHPGWMLFLLIPLYNVPEKTKNSWRILGHPMAATILYLSIGFLFDLWHPGWLLFLLIPGVPMLEKYLDAE